jgi:hypothetical protein
VVFLDFFQRIRTQHQNFAIYDTHIKVLGAGWGESFLHTLYWQFLLTLKPKSDETAQKMKNAQGASKIKLKNVNKKRMATARRLIFF